MAKPKLNLGDLYFYRARIIMSIMGVWNPPKNESTLRKLYKYVMLSLQHLFLLFQVIYMVRVLGDLEEVSQASFLLFTQACLCFKVTVFHVRMDSFRELLAQMNSDVFMPQNKGQEDILKLQATRIKRLLLGFMISSQTTCSLFALRPLFDDANRNFPFIMWMPVKPDNSPQYELGFLFQLLTISMSAFMYFGVDSVCLSMVIFGCAQLEIIKEKLLSENYRILIECVVQHQAVVKFVKLLENTYHAHLFFQLSGSIGLICMTALRILVVDWRSVQFVSMVLYLSVMCSQLFCCWYEQRARFKRALLFAMMRVSRPLEFRAGRYVPLSRQTFVTILRMSYSYFAVLKQTNSRNEILDN
ncbi:hypothetical protein MSG28_007108 [Choristoneura fumiferana]|uniref:Uncharacterized protein n=1 Tax=Choristoneura fumiferana TaxID=7141 RepID=A0ACC0JMM9_CHOFU|nr:hypothetical protein MSG28_007108 [Choristoneura fumiferana]